MPPTYVPVPVVAAKLITTAYNKDIVVILSVDRAFDRVHTTTFGRAPADKDIAAKLGDALPKMLGKMLGCDVDVMKATRYEDYRATKAAEYKAEIDRLQKELASVKEERSIAACMRLNAKLTERAEIAEAQVKAMRTEMQKFISGLSPADRGYLCPQKDVDGLRTAITESQQ